MNRTVVPHTKEGAVLIRKATTLVAAVLVSIVGYTEVGWAMITPGVVVVSVALTPVAVILPKLVSTTRRLLHSFGSITPLPLPPIR